MVLDVQVSRIYLFRTQMCDKPVLSGLKSPVTVVFAEKNAEFSWLATSVVLLIWKWCGRLHTAGTFVPYASSWCQRQQSVRLDGTRGAVTKCQYQSSWWWELTDPRTQTRTYEQADTALMYACHCQQLLVSNSKFWCWHGRVKRAVVPSLQANVQQYMPASVSCSVTDLSAPLFLYWISQCSTRYQPFSLSWLSNGATTF